MKTVYALVQAFAHFGISELGAAFNADVISRDFAHTSKTAMVTPLTARRVAQV
jgi:hypothetical protein